MEKIIRTLATTIVVLFFIAGCIWTYNNVGFYFTPMCLLGWGMYLFIVLVLLYMSMILLIV